MRTKRLLAVLATGWAVLLLLPAAVLAQPPAGPPFPPPENNVTVYDYANLLSPSTKAQATQIIAGIEQRTGAEVAIYTQYKPGSDEDSTLSDARDLMNQWGIGRKGFNDGLVILINMNRTQCLPNVSGNGQVQLFAGDGYLATYLSNQERQAIFDNDMKPLLVECDFDGAIMAALDKIDANATPEHAATLETARRIDAAVGLIGAPALLILLVGWASWSWLRYGRDPVYLDDPSILMPAPPPGLTAATAAVVWEDRATRRALTTAMLDLASRGELSFKPEGGLLGLHTKTGIQIETPPTDNPYVERNRRRPLSDAEEYALDRLQGIADMDTGNYIAPDDLLEFGKYTTKFNDRVEKHATSEGWFSQPPSKAISRWAGRGSLSLIGGVVVVIIGFNLPSAGLTLMGGALIAAGVLLIILSRVMPQRTQAGAVIYAMLAAYRRTLQATMEQARSMNQVVKEANLSWLETPDQATVWGVALGLQEDVERVIERSAEDAQQGVSTYNPWVPMWYGTGWSSGGSGSGSWGVAPGLFSGSPIPDFGGMFSALSSIGNSPSSSGGSGGFGGGGAGGGGGGGAGGGF
ncbi:MAG TPA: TPM domain-containing protein [Candidatus Limnocylindrales bacterium]|jgi:uncharacterized membrane protein YgcG